MPNISPSPYRVMYKHTCNHTYPTVSGCFIINGCMLSLPRGYQDHTATLDQRALRESRSAPFEQLSLTSWCTSAVTFTFPFMISLNKRLGFYHPSHSYTAQRPVCLLIGPCANIWQWAKVFPIITVIHQLRDEPSEKVLTHRFSWWPVSCF